MKEKNLILILALLIYKILEFKNSIVETDISNFEPFKENNYLTNFDIDFKLENNLPTIKVASAFYPFAANFVQNIYDESAYTNDLLEMVSTNEAYEYILNGEADLIIVTDPSDEQIELINASEIELTYVELYLEPLVFFVNINNKIENLNIQQIQEIYYNDNLSWQDYGGNDEKITTYQLEKNNGSPTAFETIVKNNDINKYHHEIKYMQQIINKVAYDKNGIGYAFYSYYSKMYSNINTKLLNINNEEIESENYPLLFEVYLIYREDNQNENIDKLVEWINSEEGQSLIEKIK